MPYKELYTGDRDGEKWVSILCYSGYLISNYGRVMSIERDVSGPNGGKIHYPNIILSPGTTWNGYRYVNLINSFGKKTLTIHRLVALHFVENKNPIKYKIVRHLDNDKTNNKASNLEWCNHSINNKQAWDDGLKKRYKKSGSLSPSAKPVYQFTKDGVFIKKHLARVEASRETGVPSSQINNTISGRQKSAGGFVWRACL